MFVAPYSQYHVSSNQILKSLQQVKVYHWTDIHLPHQPEKYKHWHLYISWHFIHVYSSDVTTRITPEMAKLHTICPTEIPTLLDSWVTNTAVVKMLCPQKKTACPYVFLKT